MKIDPYNGYREDNTCTICFTKNFGSPWDVELNQTYQISPVVYRGPTVTLFRRLRDEALFKEKQRIEHEKFAIIERMKLREKSVRCIQRYYRGYHVRKNMRAFVIERKTFFVRRVLEMPKRKKFLYRLLASIGHVWNLPTDTNVEKVMNLFPVYLHETVRDCIEGKWKPACEMLIPVDVGLDTTAKKTFQAAFLAFIQTKWADFRLLAANTHVQRSIASHDRLRERYRVVCNDVIMWYDCVDVYICICV
jgi:hypothetical protein